MLLVNLSKTKAYTLSKKRNATNLAAVNVSALLIEVRVLGDPVIRHIIDLFGVFIQAEQSLF